jgi:hypothetical protein
MPPTTIRHRIDSGFKSIKYDYGWDFSVFFWG